MHFAYFVLIMELNYTEENQRFSDRMALSEIACSCQRWRPQVANFNATCVLFIPCKARALLIVVRLGHAECVGGLHGDLAAPV